MRKDLSADPRHYVINPPFCRAHHSGNNQSLLETAANDAHTRHSRRNTITHHVKSVNPQQTPNHDKTNIVRETALLLELFKCRPEYADDSICADYNFDIWFADLLKVELFDDTHETACFTIKYIVLFAKIFNAFARFTRKALARINKKARLLLAKNTFPVKSKPTTSIFPHPAS